MTKKKSEKDGDYKVGYGKPPVHSQFKKGESGNPSGKSKSPKSVARLIREECEKSVTIVEKGFSR